MAFVAKPTISITYTFRDNDDKQSTMQLSIPGATAPADAVAFADSLRALIIPLSDAVCVSQNVSVGSYEDAIGAIPSSDIENKGVFTMNSGNGLVGSLTIPSILESVLQPNNQDINQADAAITSFIDAITLGLGTPLVAPVNASGADLASIKAAYKQNRRSHLRGSRTRKG